MKDKLNRFIDNTIGQFIEVSSASALYQCFDLCYFWVFCLDFPKATIQHQYAYEVYTQANEFTRQYFDIIPNTPEAVPQEGDLVVWNKTATNTAGHIGIAIDGTTSKFKVFEQNAPTGTNAHIQERNYTNVLGFLRPKVQTAGGVPQWLTVLLQEKGLSLDREGEFRAFWDKAKKYDDDIRGLQEQIKSVNEALADRAREVSLLTEDKQKISDKVVETEELLNKARVERDKAVGDAERLAIQIKTLQEEINSLNRRVDELEGEKPLMAYGWFTRFFSLFRWGR
jgi:hypothetical protein